jgi:hypothetical protein
MLHPTNALINIAVLILFAFDFVLANEGKIAENDSIVAESCVSFDTEYELEKINKITECNSTATECCSNSDKYYKRWKLLHYEQYVPLIIKIQTKGYKYNSIMSVYLDADIKFDTSFLTGSSVGCVSGKYFNCKPEKEDIDEEYNIYDSLNILYFYSPKTDTVEIPALFGKVFPVKWILEFEADNQPLNISGSYNIKISGFCTKEQLKKIAEDKRKKEVKNKNVKKAKGK